MMTIRRLPMAVPTSRTSTAPITCQCLQGVPADAGQVGVAVDSAGPVAVAVVAAIVVQAGGGVAAAAAADGVRVDLAVVLRAAAAETARPKRKRER
jgi:hypothetical protein